MGGYAIRELYVLDLNERISVYIISTSMSEKVGLAQPKFIKVKDIERARSGYNVYVKVVSAQPREIQTRDGKKIPMVDAVVADETASANAFFKGDAAHLIVKDNVVAIRNGVKRFIKDHINLQIDLFGRVTLEKGVTIATTSASNISEIEHKLPDRPRRQNNRQEGRRDNRRREGDDRREDRPRREERPRREREDREDRPRREDKDREDRPRRDNREDRRDNREDRPKRDEPRRNDRDLDRPPREDRRDNRDEDRRDRRNNNRDLDRRENTNGNYRRDRDYDRTNRGDNRVDNRPARQYQEKREENRERRAPLKWNKIADIHPGEDELNIAVKVVSVQKVGTRLRCVIGDETGVTNAFLPENENLYEGEHVVLFNARSEVVKEHIEIQLDRRGRIDKARREVPRVNQEFNLSQKAWIPIE